jgi:competence protein ComEC
VNRPVLWAAISFALGTAVADAVYLSLVFISVLGVGFLGCYVTITKLPYRDGFFLALIFLVAGCSWSVVRAPERLGDPLARHNRSHPDSIYTIEGTITQAPIYDENSGYAALRLRVEKASTALGPAPVPGGVLLRWTEPAQALHPGEAVRVRGTLSPILGEVNFGVQGIEDYYRRHGYHSSLRIRGDALEHVSSPRFHLRYWASRLRQWEAGLFSKTVPIEAQALVRAVWLGDRSALSAEDYNPYLRTGTAHILAVSGVHIGILYLTLQLVLRGIVRSRKRRAAVILGLIMMFALITGARTPILRATIMLGLYLWAEMLDREPDAPTALSLAAFLFLGYNPGLIRDTGFLLSFTSLASLLLFSQHFAERMSMLPRLLRQNVGATLGVSILPLPLTAHIFHVLSLVGPLCNLLVIPLLGGLLWLCLLVVAVGSFSTGAAILFGHATLPVVIAIQTVAEWGSAVPLGHATVTSPSTLACLAYAAMVFALYRWTHGAARPRRFLALAALSLIATATLWTIRLQPATLDILDVGHGDAIFARTPGGTTILVDGGDRSDFVDQGARTVVPWLLSEGVKSLDYVVVTHADRDHIGGIGSVLDLLDVGEVVLGPAPSARPLSRELAERCRALGIPVRQVAAGDGLSAADATFSILHPPREGYPSEENNQSIVLHVEWSGLSALLTGDIEAVAERLFVVPKTDVLKVPHHGSHTSSSADFLEQNAPQLAVVSTREGGNRMAMAPAVVRRYEERSIPIYRTDYHGGIRIRSRRDVITVETARGKRGYSLAPRDN